MAWTSLANALFLVGKPITSSTGIALRDNPSAIAEGASGAPRIMDAALGTTPTATGKNWVTERNALAGVGEVGTFAMLSVQEFPAGTDTWTPGRYVAGIALKYASASGATGGTASGNWRCMGYAQSGPIGTISATSPLRVTLWLKVSS